MSMRKGRESERKTKRMQLQRLVKVAKVLLQPRVEKVLLHQKELLQLLLKRKMKDKRFNILRPKITSTVKSRIS